MATLPKIRLQFACWGDVILWFRHVKTYSQSLSVTDNGLGVVWVHIIGELVYEFGLSLIAIGVFTVFIPYYRRIVVVTVLGA